METLFDVIRRPLITEKTNYLSGKLNQYVFEVDAKATRSLVKDSIEKVFDVKVTRVNIINTAAKQSKRGRSRRMVIRKSAYKKAIVTLAEGSRISLFEGVE